MIQHNSAAAEEMASTAEELNSQAEQLLESINFFRFSESGNGSRTLDGRQALLLEEVSQGETRQ